MLMLNAKNITIGMNIVSVGGVSSAPVHPREVLKPAILANACALILAHNHPSGDLTPSNADKAITQKIIHASDIIGIRSMSISLSAWKMTGILALLNTDISRKHMKRQQNGNRLTKIKEDNKMKFRTVCAWCNRLILKRVPKTKNSLALSKNGVMTSHGLCPRCRKNLEPFMD